MRQFTSKLLKRAWEGERFSYFGLTFDVEKAQQIVESNPHEKRVAPKNFLESFVGKTEVGESMEEEEFGSSSLLNSNVNKKHMKTVDHQKPGIVASFTFKPNKQYPESKPTYILIDGNHRAKKSMILGEPFEVYILTPEESWECMASQTPPFLLKNYINPTKKPAKARKLKVSDE